MREKEVEKIPPPLAGTVVHQCGDNDEPASKRTPIDTVSQTLHFPHEVQNCTSFPLRIFLQWSLTLCRTHRILEGLNEGRTIVLGVGAGNIRGEFQQLQVHLGEAVYLDTSDNAPAAETFPRRRWPLNLQIPWVSESWPFKEKKLETLETRVPHARGRLIGSFSSNPLATVTPSRAIQISCHQLRTKHMPLRSPRMSHLRIISGRLALSSMGRFCSDSNIVPVQPEHST